MKELKKIVCVVCPKLGAFSEVWMLRQLEGFSEIRPIALTWKFINPQNQSFDGLEVIQFDGSAGIKQGAGRWLHRLLQAPEGNYFAFPRSKVRRLSGLLRTSNISAFLCHFGHTALQMLPVAKAMEIPLVVHFHGLDLSSMLRNRWYRWSLERMLPQLSAMVCVGTEQRKRLIELGADPGRIHLIPCGVPVDRFPLREPLEEGPVRFICVSRLVQWKGIHHCIGAFARLAPRLRGSELVIVGDGEQRKELEDLATKLGISDRVAFKGSVPETEVRALLERSDVFLQHSLNHHSGWFEGFGVSVAEAAAIGLPVVVSACGGLLDQVVDGVTGMIVAQRDEDAMADAMLRLAEDPALRQRLGRAGRERMIQHFDTVRQVEKLENVLLGTLPMTRPSRRRHHRSPEHEPSV